MKTKRRSTKLIKESENLVTVQLKNGTDITIWWDYKAVVEKKQPLLITVKPSKDTWPISIEMGAVND